MTAVKVLLLCAGLAMVSEVTFAGQVTASGLQARLSKDRKIILIKKKPVKPKVQQETISGTVTDASSGETLPGVNISVKGTTTGTSTDGNGQYELTVESLQDTLTFSFIGYERQEVPIKGRTTIDMALKIQTIAIEGLVVTAQGVRQQERSLGYSVASVKSDEIATQPSSDVVRKLKGKIPGVDIQQSGGVAGSATNITIRGASTVSGNNTPLFIVDGVRFNASTNALGSFDSGGALSTSSRFLDLDPDNIESIDVLKGLAASTIYGEEGKNGVVLVTTRSGTFQNNEQGFNVTLSQSYFVNKIASLPDYQNNYGNGGDQYYAAFFSNWGPNFKSKQLEEYSLFRGYDEQGYALFPPSLFPI